MESDRRSMLLALGAAAAAGHASAAGMACASSHTGAGSKPAHAHSPVDRMDAVRRTVAECVAAGEACLAHCLEALGAGDTSLADCAGRVHDMLAVCRGLGSLVAAKSELVAQMASVCGEACMRCKDAREPHVEHHPECKACFEACEATLTAIRPLVG